MEEMYVDSDIPFESHHLTKILKSFVQLNYGSSIMFDHMSK